MLGGLGGLPPSKVGGSGGRSPPEIYRHLISRNSFLINLGGYFNRAKRLMFLNALGNNRKPKNEFFEGDVRENFIKLTWEEISGVIFHRTYMTWGRETRFKGSKRVKI